MNYNVLFLIFSLFLIGCQENIKESTKQEISLKKELQKNNKDPINTASEILFKKETESNLKQRLDNLNSQLQQKNLHSLRLNNAGFKKHQEYFEGFYNRKDLSKSSPNSPKDNFDKALQNQLKQIEKLSKENDKIW